jgi:hypothetical protein
LEKLRSNLVSESERSSSNSNSSNGHATEKKDSLLNDNSEHSDPNSSSNPMNQFGGEEDDEMRL